MRICPSFHCSFLRFHLSLLLTACVWAGVAGLLGEGRRQWLDAPSPDITNQSQVFLHGTFPPGFLWGTGTSAYQTEGARHQDGKGASVWDHFTHSRALAGGATAGAVDTADVSSDSYSHLEEDVQALSYLGVRSFSFSLSWGRLFPDGDASAQPRLEAVKHYSRLIDQLRERGVEPVVTLHHWDLPQALQERYGGWRNHSLVGLFDSYAAFCFRTYGARVRYWITMHNPYLVAVQGYGTGEHAPGEKGDPSTPFMVAHNLIRAHAKAWHTYNTSFRPSQHGQVSIVLGSHWIVPRPDPSRLANIDLCQRSMEAVLGWFANPIFGDGDYPATLRSRQQDLLPEFTPEERVWVRGTADFFALSFGPNNLRLDRSLGQYRQTVSLDLRGLLGWIKREYGGQLKVLLAEVGWFSKSSAGREDTEAIYVMKTFINKVLKAIVLDGVQVFGYTAWSLVDGFEWTSGYSIRRGLFYVDFTHPNRTRLAKTTAQFYKHVIKENGFPDDETTREVKGRFPCGFHWGVADSTLQVHLHPISPQFTDPHLYSWNVTGDGSLRPVRGVRLLIQEPQCSDYLAIRGHLRLFQSTAASHYHFALNWSLILPRGDLASLDTQALRYYRCVLTELHKQGREAMITLYYPTQRAPNLGLPEKLHASGGWLNQSTVLAFQEYAALCYRELGPWVRYWITINEPNRLVDVYLSGEEQQLAAHNLLLAHAKAWRMYEKEHSSQQGGLVSLALHADWAEPANPFLESHVTSTQRFLLFELGRFLDPLLGRAGEEPARGEGGGGGAYPEEVRAYLEERAPLLGIRGSPLPRFTPQEREELQGAMGFIALNHFTTRLISPRPLPAPQSPNPHYSLGPNHGCLLQTDPTWPSSRPGSVGQALVPWGLRRVLGWVSQRYGRALPVIITACGIDDQAPVNDIIRQHYYKSYLQEALKARQLDGVNLDGFYMWKLQDSHDAKFGLFSSLQHQSRPKGSVSVYRKVIASGGFPAGNATETCLAGEELAATCDLCARLWENKPLLFFGACFLLSAAMLGTVAAVAVRRRRTGVRAAGERGGGRRAGVPACPANRRMARQPWEGPQRAADRMRVVRY